MADPSPPALPPPGWYADPEQPDTWRYWDGSAWTDQRAPMQQAPPASAAPESDSTRSESKMPMWGGIAVAVVIGVIVLAAIGGGDEGSESSDDGGSSAPAQPEPPFTEAKIQGNCPGFMAVGLPMTFSARITNTGSEDWPATFVATDDFDPFVVNSVTLDGEEGSDPAPPGYEAYRFRGLDANETARLSVDVTPKDAGNTDLEFGIWGDDPGASGIPEGNFLYGCTDLAIQP